MRSIAKPVSRPERNIHHPEWNRKIFEILKGKILPANSGTGLAGHELVGYDCAFPFLTDLMPVFAKMTIAPKFRFTNKILHFRVNTHIANDCKKKKQG